MSIPFELRTDSESDRALPPALEKALFGFMASHVLLAGDETGIFDRLAAVESLTAEEVAASVGLLVDPTRRFLQACASLGLLTKRGDGFAMPREQRPFLAWRGEENFSGWLAHLRSVTVHSFSHLADSLRTGQPQLSTVLRRDGASPFDLLYADPERVRAFADSMWNLGFAVSRELAPQAPLPRARSLVDLGGGSGSFAVAAVLAHPALHATVLDLPPLEAHCGRMAQAFGVEGRVRFAAADFLADDLPSADAFSLGYILSDWSEEKGTLILERIFSRLEPGGSVIILERLLDEDGAGPASATLMDLCMLLESFGRHRSESDYLRWLRRVGFKDCFVRRSSGHKHMICGTKA
jgi:hypothetical protein